MSHALPPLIAALLKPSLYADQQSSVHRVDCVETHSAWVLLAGDRAYKIKKPVRWSFMDFSTLALRRQACQDEVRINQRFESFQSVDGPLYLGVLPILGTPQQPRWGQASAVHAVQAQEFAVVMRRFDESTRLDHVCARGELTANHLARFATDMAQFQARAAVVSRQQPWGHAAAAMRWPRDNFATLRRILSEPADLHRLERLSDWAEQRFMAIEPLLSRRRQKDRVREGHGDLHLANLILTPQGIQAFDAVEFNEGLRWIDVTSDMAFLWMDLLSRGQPGLANVLLSAWLDASGDVSAPTVWSFFASYRAGVRAKVAAIRLEQHRATGPASSHEADACLADIRRYLALAQDIAQPPEARLVITHGLSGSGKTWASQQWLATETTGRAIRLRSDVERKRLHGLGPLEGSGSGLNSGLYTPQAHQDTQASLLARTRRLLAEGWTVLVDAAFLRHAERASFAALAAEQRVPFHILACEAAPELLHQRISDRLARADDASEATPAVLAQQMGWIEPLLPAERALCLA
ncbi:MAG: hypothetical protein RLZZ352_1734 [Pseudomonadota bacterium]|jgi:aminoglycoside phosphotransferase family enzyme/predicted kinase